MRRQPAVVTVLGALAVAVVAVGGIYAWLPDPGALRTRNPASTAFIERACSADCPLDWTPLPEMSIFVRRAVVLAEDAEFFEHGAISLPSLRQALQRNLREGRIVWGGSSLTMQLARNLYLYPDRTLKRKFLEMLLAVKIERALTKERILEIYLNVAEWAPDVFGIGAAARHYFGKRPGELGPLEAAFLASILPSPRRAGEPEVRERFSRKGAILLDRIVASFLPRGPDAFADPESCPEMLTEEEAGMAASILATLFARHGLELVSGDGALLSREEVLSPLAEEQRALVGKIVSRLAAGRPPLACRRARDGSGAALTPWSQREDEAPHRYWLPGTVYPRFEALMSEAAAAGIPLLVQSAYRAPGYQTYLILRELRVRGSCLSEVRKIVESPERSEHSCLDTTAVDFGAPDGFGAAFAGTPTFRWLQEHGEDFGLRMSHPQDDPDGVGPEPWHWRFVGTAAP